jgi:hypothetical protein
MENNEKDPEYNPNYKPNETPEIKRDLKRHKQPVIYILYERTRTNQGVYYQPT